MAANNTYVNNVDKGINNNPPNKIFTLTPTNPWTDPSQNNPLDKLPENPKRFVASLDLPITAAPSTQLAVNTETKPSELTSPPPPDQKELPILAIPTENQQDRTVGGAESPKGTYISASAGAKVWVFFHGGDPQRPVYFAANNEPSGWAAARGKVNPSNSQLYTDNRYSTGMMGAINAGFRWVCDEVHKLGEIPTIKSFLTIATNTSHIKVGSQGVTTKTQGQAAILCRESVVSSNSSHVVTQGNTKVYSKGSHTILVGDHSYKAKAASEKRQTAINAIEKKKEDAVKNTEGDDVECPICAEKYLHDKSDFMNKVIDFISSILNMLPYNCFNWPVTKFLMDMVVVPMLSEISGLAATGGQGCGTCKNGRVKAVQSKVDASNKEGADELKNQQSNIDEADKDLPPSVYAVHNATGPILLKSGFRANDATATHDTGVPNVLSSGVDKGNKNGPGQPNLVEKGFESAPNIMVNNAVSETGNDITLESGDKIRLIAGSPGIVMSTKGNVKIEADSFDLTAAKGTLNIGSNNVTNISGNIVNIRSKDNGGVIINDANCVGKMSVTGNMAVIGAISTNGPICTPFLQVPSMRLQTKSSSSAKSVTDGATWYLEGSTLLTMKDMAQTAVLRNLKPGYCTSLFGILTLIQEIYNAIMGMIPLHIMPIGFSVCCTCGIVPVFGFRHTHSLVSQDHDHDHTVPKGNYYNDVKTCLDSGPGNSSVPTPPPGQGDGPSPGPKSLGSCGGGGFGFGDSNSSASKNRKNRNASVGLTDGDYNYTRITTGDSWTYDTNGELIPPPSYGLENDC